MSVYRPTRRAAMALAAIAISALMTAPAALAQSASPRPDLNLDANGVILKGYDPVAYFADGKPTKGSPDFTATHDGATYWFASAAHRDAFAKEPEKYVPAFGGYCAMGVVFNKKIDVDPTVWRVVDGKLYVNVNPKAAKRWAEDVPGNISKGKANWTEIKGKPASAL